MEDGGVERLEWVCRAAWLSDGCPCPSSSLPALHQLPFSLCKDRYIFSVWCCSNSCPAPGPYRSRPRYRHGASVAAPSLRRLPVLFVGSFEHLLHVSDLVLAHRRHVHVAPERQRRGHREGQTAGEDALRGENQRG